MARRRRRRGRKPIRIKKANRGKLRRAAGVKKGQKIPMSKLQQMKRSRDPAVRKRATFAINARGWNKGGRRRKRGARRRRR